jgi:hypothetical protein
VHYDDKKRGESMKVGDIVYAKHPRMTGMTDKPGIIVKKEPMYRLGIRYQVYFPDIGLKWVEWSSNLLPLEACWEEE